jgi:hypothetical protein
MLQVLHYFFICFVLASSLFSALESRHLLASASTTRSNTLAIIQPGNGNFLQDINALERTFEANLSDSPGDFDHLLS